MAIFREYVEPLRPGHVVWLFYDGNDLGDYLAERASPLLRAYFEPDHLQDLVRLSDQVSLAMRRYIDQQSESIEVATLALERPEKRSVLGEMINFMLLRRARAILRLTREPNEPTNLAETEWREITGIWREVMETQHRQAGQITFVYMPSHFHFLAHDSASFEALERKVVTLWSGLGVDYISLTALLEATENPLAYYSHDVI